MRKLLSVILAAALALALMSPAMALTDTVPAGFTPIYTPEDLDAIRDGLDANYILMNDIDMGDWGNWTPIGSWDGNYPSDVYFTGTLDGNGYEIQNLTIDCNEGNVEDTSSEFIGLFAVLVGTVKNLGLVDVSIRGGFETQADTVSAGGIAGYGGYSVLVENCYVTGEIAANSAQRNCVSGLVGYLGDGIEAGIIRNCYSVVELTAQTSGSSMTNGIAMIVAPTDGLLENCYSNVDPVWTVYVGDGVNIDSANTENLTETQLKQQANFAGFDWTTPVWYIKEGETYPKLRPFPPTFFPDTDTGVEAEVDEGVFPPGTVMDVSEQDAGNFVLGPGNSVHAVYDIKFVKDNTTVQPDGKVTVRLPFKDVSPGTSANWKVYYVERDSQGNITAKVNMNARVVEIEGVWYWEFETDHFSLYAVVQEETTQPQGIFGTNPKWTGAWYHYLLFFFCFGFLWMWF